MNTNKLYRDLVHQITTPSLPQKLEIAFSVILLLSIPVFWLWLLAQPHYSVGVVSLVESFSDDESVAQLTLLGKEDFIIGQTKLLVAHIESWVFTLGERITLPENEFINPPLLDTEEMATLPLLGYLLTHPVSNWLEALGTSHGWAMVVSALLLIMAGFAFRMTYVILMCGASLATLWHVLTIGSWMGFFELGDVGLYLLLGVSALVILRWTRTHRHFSIAEPAIAVFMWWLFGETILIRLGLDSQWLYGLTFFSGPATARNGIRANCSIPAICSILCNLSGHLLYYRILRAGLCKPDRGKYFFTKFGKSPYISTKKSARAGQ
ncbi:hypothetical protein HJ009_03220 [Vibrio parahaemolyticus]|nr:hypothetical protein [Vibrio parahaemolyticus]